MMSAHYTGGKAGESLSTMSVKSGPDVVDNGLRAVAGGQRAPLHPSITDAQISRMVDTFYERAFADPRLGPIFMRHIGADRAPHMQVIKQFWSSVLLRTGAYAGRPVPVHLKLTEVEPDDFRIWLAYFRLIAGECFEHEAAPLVIAAAERIAESLWLAMFGAATSTIRFGDIIDNGKEPDK
jgi:hemoglobin